MKGDKRIHREKGVYVIAGIICVIILQRHHWYWSAVVIRFVDHIEHCVTSTDTTARTYYISFTFTTSRPLRLPRARPLSKTSCTK